MLGSRNQGQLYSTKCNFHAFVVLGGVCYTKTKLESISRMFQIAPFEILSRSVPATKKPLMSAVIFATHRDQKRINSLMKIHEPLCFSLQRFRTILDA